MRLVIDTDVLVAAIRSPTGASAALLTLLIKREATMLLSVAMAFEYEAVCMRAEHRLVADVSGMLIMNALGAIFETGEPVETHYHWRPQLSDPNDEMILEAAINGRADAIVTFNQRDFSGVSKQFGIEILTPSEALWRIRTCQRT